MDILYVLDLRHKNNRTCVDDSEIKVLFIKTEMTMTISNILIMSQTRSTDKFNDNRYKRDPGEA